MDSKRLLSFLRSAELGSLSAAAEDLGYSTSAVSQLVASLENEFGMRLLVRTTKGVYPTPEAEGLIPVIKDYLAGEQQIYDYVTNIKGVSEGQLSITAYPSIATAWLPEVVSKFCKEHPGISINIMECVRTDIYRHLDHGEAELGFLAYSDPMPYEWIPLAEERLIAVLPVNHKLASADSYPIREAENDNFILSSFGQESEILRVLKENNVSPNIKYTSYDTPVNLAMVQQGLGISIVNELSASRWNERLVKLPLDPPATVTFGIAYISYDRLSPAARIFMDSAVKELTQSEQRK